jgi:hypothetical protein
VHIPPEDGGRIPNWYLETFQSDKPSGKSAWLEMIVPTGSHNDCVVGVPGDVRGIPQDRVRYHAISL